MDGRRNQPLAESGAVVKLCGCDVDGAAASPCEASSFRTVDGGYTIW
jgi:hypothetical protein